MSPLIRVQDHALIVDDIGVVAASLAKAATAEDGKLLLFRPAFGLGCRAAKECLEFLGWHSEIEDKDFKKLVFGEFIYRQAGQELLHEIGLRLPRAGGYLGKGKKCSRISSSISMR
ncbi:hypothetical protein KSB_26460 [Ktedonobacter robiniae]|uniref:Uncharacterized protein n=1 Tax=Ktedonobacter robiniae TaxID=2778365 RepID=A0ABQ3UN73_9CHLR|nr:hypothetical protein KSB_26460 [Ktedonobacter robiniae]